MQERIAAARRSIKRIPKSGYVRPRKEPTDRQLIEAMYYEDLSALQQMRRAGDARTLERVMRLCENLQVSAAGLRSFRRA